NKKDERGIVVRNKARLVAQGYTQEERIDYDEVFAPVARIEAIRLFLAYASFMGFIVHQMDVKSAFLYGTIEEEVYVCQLPGFEDLYFPDKMSSMGKLTFFLGLQIMQKDDEICISQDKHMANILKKFDFSYVKKTSTPIETNKALLKDEKVEDVDAYLYRSMIGSLIYLTASRPDIIFAVCACAKFHVTPKVSHLNAMKRIFRYLKGQPKLGLWYPRDSPFDLEAFSDSDYVRASLDRKSTTGGCQFLGKRPILWQCKRKTRKGQNQDKTEQKREAHNATFVISSHTKKVFANMKREGKDFSRKVTPLFETMMKKQKSKRKQRKEIEVHSPSSDIPNEEDVPTTSNDPLPSDCSSKEIASLKKKVKKLEQKRKSKTSRLKRLRKVGTAKRVKYSTKANLGDQKDASKQGRMIDNIDQDVEITLVDNIQGRMNEEDMFGVNDLDRDEVVMDVSASEKAEHSVKVVEKEVSTADPVTTTGEIVTTADVKVTTAATTLQISKDEITLAQTLIEIKAAKHKAITTAATIVTIAAKEKGKGKMVEPERPLKRKDQIMMDEEVAKNLEAQMQAELEEEERLARLKEEETNVALVAKWDNTQAMMDAYCKLAVRLQEKEREELIIEEKYGLFVELMDKRKKHSARLKEENIRTKPPTKAQKRNHMCTYLKNMANYNEKAVEGSEKAVEGSDKEVEDSKKAEEGNSKRAGSDLEHEDAKREDLEVLWSIIKARFKKTKPTDDMDNLLFYTLKTMFEHHVKDNIRKSQQGSVKVIY
nr:retrotransposon protein, putative, unclassified [Tanacetum cinerariifolium]